MFRPFFVFQTPFNTDSIDKQCVAINSIAKIQIRGNIAYGAANPYDIPVTAMYNLLFVQFKFLPTEQTETSKNSCLDILFNIYLSHLVWLEGNHDFRGNHDLKTVNLRFPGYLSRF